MKTVGYETDVRRALPVFRFDAIKKGRSRFKQDGINSLLYKRLDLQEMKLYTWIYVSIDKKKVISVRQKIHIFGGSN